LPEQASEQDLAVVATGDGPDLGFLTWLGFLVSTGLRLVRSPA
jgi:hypothetical protein